MSRARAVEGNIYKRGNALWLWYWDAKGVRQYAATGLLVGREADARAMLKRTIAEDRRLAQVSSDGTLRAFFEGPFLEHRQKKTAGWKDERSRVRLHALPHLGDRQLREIGWQDVEALIHKLNAAGLAPRTVRNVFGVLRLVFARAIREGVAERNPCNELERGTLPPKVDKDPEWRRNAIFTGEEIAGLVLDARIPLWRRIDYAMAYFTGTRGGERYFLRWRHLADKKPLAELAFVGSFNVRVWREGLTKTRVPRYLPVHPALAEMLETWRASGWAAYMGREPGADDLILPYRRAYLKLAAKGDPNRRTQNLCWQHLNETDLPTLGFRPRRAHDFRATMISLGIAHGATEEILSTLTHPSPSKAFEAYQRFSWPTLCAEIAKLPIGYDSVTVRLARGGDRRLPLSSDTASKRTGPHKPQSDGWVAEYSAARRPVTAVTESDPSGYAAYAARAGLSHERTVH
jgi:integrase